MKINGQSLPFNAFQWKFVPGESEVLTETTMSGLLPALVGRGFGMRKATLQIMVKDVNDRNSIELSMSQILQMLNGSVTIELDENSYASFFYGAVKSYAVKPLIKKRSQILILELIGVLYDEEYYANYYYERETPDSSPSPHVSSRIEFPASDDYRPCAFYIGVNAYRADPPEVNVYGLFFNTKTEEPINSVHVTTNKFLNGTFIYLDGLTGETGLATGRSPDVDVEIKTIYPYEFEKSAVKPIQEYGFFPTYPLVRPGSTSVSLSEFWGYFGLRIFNIRR